MSGHWRKSRTSYSESLESYSTRELVSAREQLMADVHNYHRQIVPLSAGNIPNNWEGEDGMMGHIVMQFPSPCQGSPREKSLIYDPENRSASLVIPQTSNSESSKNVTDTTSASCIIISDDSDSDVQILSMTESSDTKDSEFLEKQDCVQVEDAENKNVGIISIPQTELLSNNSNIKTETNKNSAGNKWNVNKNSLEKVYVKNGTVDTDCCGVSPEVDVNDNTRRLNSDSNCINDNDKKVSGSISCRE